jgi:hypothetical protein
LCQFHEYWYLKNFFDIDFVHFSDKIIYLKFQKGHANFFICEYRELSNPRNIYDKLEDDVRGCRNQAQDYPHVLDHERVISSTEHLQKIGLDVGYDQKSIAKI